MKTKAPAPSPQVLRASQEVSKPTYVIDQRSLVNNLEALQALAQSSGAKVVLAQKAFAQPQLYPLIGRYLDGACASGLWEAQLASLHLPEACEVITCSPAYNEGEVEALLPLTHHLDFNSLSQWRTHQAQCLAYKREATREICFGLRINPQCSTGETPLYDPCAVGSRLGVTQEQLKGASRADLEGIEGLHFHTLCEQGVEDLQKTVRAVEEQFGDFLRSSQMSYLNLGGGHWITKEGYDQEALITLIRYLSETYQLQVYLEPGEAVAIHSGVLVASVLDLHVNGGVTNAILDVSATAHMPDVLEMPYRPDVYLPSGEEATVSGSRHCYRLTGNTCLAGDQIGDYCFSRPLEVGDKLIFNDMAHYTMVKTTFFNGVQHPDIMLLTDAGALELLRSFSFQDYLFLKQSPNLV